MFRKLLFIVLVFALSACQGEILPAATPTVTAAPTRTPTPTLPPTPTETLVPILKLDKPMTTVYNPFDLEPMPTVSEENVTSGDLAATVQNYWKTHPELGIYDDEGNLIVPPGVEPIKPEQ
jgi:hypothetical protein